MSDSHLRDNLNVRYTTPELAAAATARNERAAAERAAAAKAQAEAWEAGLKARFMATPGATEDDWRRTRQAVVDEARKRAALSEDDSARAAFAATYM